MRTTPDRYITARCRIRRHRTGAASVLRNPPTGAVGFVNPGSVPLPGGVQKGDLLLLLTWASVTGRNDLLSQGWALVLTPPFNNAGLEMYWKVAGNAEPAPSWTYNQGTSWAASLRVYKNYGRGLHGAPILAAAQNVNFGGGTSPWQVPRVSATGGVDAATVVYVWGNEHNFDASPVTIDNAEVANVNQPTIPGTAAGIADGDEVRKLGTTPARSATPLHADTSAWSTATIVLVPG